MAIAILVAVMVVSGVLCHFIAKRHRANPVFWGVMGFVFGPLAIPFALFSAPRAAVE